MIGPLVLLFLATFQARPCQPAIDQLSPLPEETEYIKVNKRDDYGRTPLINALIQRRGSTESDHLFLAHLESLIKMGADINQSDDNGQSPLHYAEDVLSAQFLLNNGADIGKKDTTFYHTPLFKACSRGRSEVVQFLLENNEPVDQLDRFGDTPLYWAKLDQRNKQGDTPYNTEWYEYDPKTIAVLLKYGANVNHRSGRATVLTNIMMKRKKKLGDTAIECVKLLLSHAASTACNDRYDHCNTVLHKAIEELPSELIEPFLKENEALINEKKNYANKETALHLAISLNRTDLITPLIRYGADPSIQNGAGDTPLHLACQNVHGLEAIQLLVKHPQGQKTINILNKHSANLPIHCVTELGSHNPHNTPTAVQETTVQMAQTLYNATTPDTFSDQDQARMLYFSVQKNNVPLTRWLIQQGAPINYPYSCGNPIHRAARFATSAMVKLLLKQGATQVPDCFGETPLVLAERRGYPEVVDLLKNWESAFTR